MPTDTLTDAKCRAAKPQATAYKIFDGGGLFLWVSPKGAKVWRLAYRLAGKPQTMSFGPYPEVSLAEARKKRAEAKATLREGSDPMAPRKAKPAPTLREEWNAYWSGKQDLTDAYKRDGTRCMETWVFPTLGDRPINEIDKAALLEALGRMNAAGRYPYVRKARMWLAQMFDFSVEHGRCQANPARLIQPEKAFGKAREKHFSAIEPHEAGEFMDRLGMEVPELQAVLACRFLAYTWTRTTEMRMMLWDELVATDTWLIDGERMKRGRDHLVPLSAQAQDIIRQMRARSRGSRFVWPSEHNLDRPMSENAVLALLYRIGYKGRMTGHGWRSVASTWANEAGYNTDAVELQLAHVPENATRSAYNRATYFGERRAMLQDWADWLDAQTAQT